LRDRFRLEQDRRDEEQQVDHPESGDDHAHPVVREQGAADPVGVGIARQT